jgi:hypothetical protein
MRISLSAEASQKKSRGSPLRRIRGSVAPSPRRLHLLVSVFERLTTVDDDRLDLSFAVIDFDFQSAEERRMVLLDLFNAVFQQGEDSIQIPTRPNRLLRSSRMST